MKLQQIQDFKHWHLGHAQGHGLELGCCDLVLAAWVSGWTMLPVAALLDEWTLLPASLLLTLMPSAYWALRRTLHRRSLLRCDWLNAVHPPR